MSSLSRITCHAVHAMAPHARESLARELYAVHSQIFEGLAFEDFREYVVERPSWRTWIYVKHNPSGHLVGYTAIHAFQVPVQGRTFTVIRMEAGTLPAHRGRDLTMVYGVLRFLRIWLRHPWRPTCMFAALTHPSSYTFLSHYAPVVWPHASRRHIPAQVMTRMEALAAAFELEHVDPAKPLVRRVDWMTLESEEERTRWRKSRRPDTRFYIENNPDYAKGHGLLTYIPVNGVILARAMVRFLVGRAGRIAKLLMGEVPPVVDGTSGRSKPRAPGPHSGAPASRW